MRLYIISAMLVFSISAMLVFSGCQGADSLTPTVNTQLKRINLAYVLYSDSYAGTPARNLDELITWWEQGTVHPESEARAAEETRQRLRAGDYVLVCSQKAKFSEGEGTKIITAYRKPSERGTFVVFADGRVEWMTTAEQDVAVQRSKAPDTKRPGDG